jgi:uncharacterized protein (TIGR04222 family)
MELFASWTGSDFLLFYSVLLGFSCLFALWIPQLMREPGRRGSLDDLESIAVLAGGRARLTDTLLAELYVRGALTDADKGKLAVTNPRLAASPAAAALAQIDQPITLGAAHKALSGRAERVTARLQRAGLVMRTEDETRLRWFSIAPFLALLMIGIYRHRAGSALGEPTEYLSLLLALTGVLAVIRYARSDARTVEGIAAVRDLCARNDRYSRAPLPDEAAMAVALFGTGVLVGTPWEPLHAMRRQDGDGGSSSDSSSSDGGSGCGGGCGGCGG